MLLHKQTGSRVVTPELILTLTATMQKQRHVQLLSFKLIDYTHIHSL